MANDDVTRRGWAAAYIEKLRKGETVSFRPNGSAMSPRIKSGQLCTVAPVDTATLKPGDVVLCRVNGAEYLHFVKELQGPRYRIGNNRGGLVGWVTAKGIFGRLVSVED
jgi:hypothetical protein